MVGGTLSTAPAPSRARRSLTDAIDTVASTASDGAIVTTRMPSTVPSPMSPVPSMTATVVTRSVAEHLEAHRAVGVGPARAGEVGAEVGEAARVAEVDARRVRHRRRLRNGAGSPRWTRTDARSSGRMRRGASLAKS